MKKLFLLQIFRLVVIIVDIRLNKIFKFLANYKTFFVYYNTINIYKGSKMVQKLIVESLFSLCKVNICNAAKYDLMQQHKYREHYT